jgi:hypothetical protein
MDFINLIFNQSCPVRNLHVNVFYVCGASASVFVSVFVQLLVPQFAAKLHFESGCEVAVHAVLKKVEPLTPSAGATNCLT